jgi:hypothetical protein
MGVGQLRASADLQAGAECPVSTGQEAGCAWSKVKQSRYTPWRRLGGEEV